MNASYLQQLNARIEALLDITEVWQDKSVVDFQAEYEFQRADLLVLIAEIRSQDGGDISLAAILAKVQQRHSYANLSKQAENQEHYYAEGLLCISEEEVGVIDLNRRLTDDRYRAFAQTRKLDLDSYDLNDLSKKIVDGAIASQQQCFEELASSHFEGDVKQAGLFWLIDWYIETCFLLYHDFWEKIEASLTEANSFIDARHDDQPASFDYDKITQAMDLFNSFARDKFQIDSNIFDKGAILLQDNKEVPKKHKMPLALFWTALIRLGWVPSPPTRAKNEELFAKRLGGKVSGKTLRDYSAQGYNKDIDAIKRYLSDQIDST